MQLNRWSMNALVPSENLLKISYETPSNPEADLAQHAAIAESSCLRVNGSSRCFSLTPTPLRGMSASGTSSRTRSLLSSSNSLGVHVRKDISSQCSRPCFECPKCGPDSINILGRVDGFTEHSERGTLPPPQEDLNLRV